MGLLGEGRDTRRVRSGHGCAGQDVGLGPGSDQGRGDGCAGRHHAGPQGGVTAARTGGCEVGVAGEIRVGDRVRREGHLLAIGSGQGGAVGMLDAEEGNCHIQLLPGSRVLGDFSLETGVVIAGVDHDHGSRLVFLPEQGPGHAGAIAPCGDHDGSLRYIGVVGVAAAEGDVALRVLEHMHGSAGGKRRVIGVHRLDAVATVDGELRARIVLRRIAGGNGDDPGAGRRGTGQVGLRAVVAGCCQHDDTRGDGVGGRDRFGVGALAVGRTE